MSKPRIKVPDSISAGEVFTIKTLIRHRMESGHRIDESGDTVPREIINKFTCEFNGKPVFACDMFTAISTNPYFAFTAKVYEAGTFKFTWVDDNGDITEATQDITLDTTGD